MAVIGSLPRVDILRSVDDVLSHNEAVELDRHLKTCQACRDYMSFVQNFSQGLKELKGDPLAAVGSHPSTELLVGYEAGELDEKISREVRDHVLFCEECTDDFYALRRAVRAPSWTSVVIEAIRSKKETVLKSLEVIGMGELVPLPATVMRGTPDEAQSRIDIAQQVTDADGEAEVHFFVDGGDGSGPTVRISVGIHPPRPGWRAKLLDTHEKTIASVPLPKEKQTLHSSLTPGTFIAQIVKDEDVLAECRLKIHSSHEPASHGNR